MNEARIRLSPLAASKISYYLTTASTEVGMLGVTDKDSLLVRDVFVPRQRCSVLSTEFDMNDVSDYVTRMCEDGYEVSQVMRVWIHTHPGMSPNPSGVDYQTFEEAYGDSDFAVMCVVGDRRRSTSVLDINTKFGRIRSFLKVSWPGSIPSLSLDDRDALLRDRISKVEARPVCEFKTVRPYSEGHLELLMKGVTEMKANPEFGIRKLLGEIWVPLKKGEGKFSPSEMFEDYVFSIVSDGVCYDTSDGERYVPVSAGENSVMWINVPDNMGVEELMSIRNCLKK